MAVITGNIITDAVVNMKAALDSQKTTWGVVEVYRYQAHEIGKRGDCIAIEFVAWNQDPTGFADGTIVVDHKVTMRIWYVHATGVRIDAAFDDIYSTLSKIVAYLIENPRPNGYGENLVVDQQFGATVEAITAVDSETGGLLAGKFTVVHTLVGKAHTLTIAP